MPTRIGPALGSSPPGSCSSASPPFGDGCAPVVMLVHSAPVSAFDAAPVAHNAMPADAVPVEIGGYRVVRLLARGSRALTVLVHAEGDNRVARVFSSRCPAAVIDAEVAVLDAIGASEPALRDHAVALDDLVTLPDGRLTLLLQQVAGPRLDDVVDQRRGRLELGEAVTVLAPIADALDAAHRAGLTGLGLHPAAIRFRPSGAPVLLRVQNALAGPALPERFRALEPAYRADVVAFEQLGAVIAAAVAQPQRAALLTALRAASSGSPRAHALFDVAEPSPILLDAANEHDGPRAPETLVVSPTPIHPDPPGATPLLPVLSRSAVRRAVLATSIIGTLRELGLPASVIEPVEQAVTGVAQKALRVRTVVRGALRGRAVPVRPRFLVAGAGGALALVIAVVLVGGIGEAPHVPPNGPDGGSAQDGEVASTGATSTAPRERQEQPESALPESALHPEADDWQGLVATLVDRWLRCRDAPTPTCALEVTHRGSAAELLIAVDDPRHALLSRWSAVRGDAVVVERMGGAVLIDLVAAGTTTASLLLVRSEAGWRLRDVIG